MHCFITGTDTNVGKTYITKILLENLRADGIDAVGYKPIACGDREDAHILSAASGNLDIDLVNPLWLKTAAAPWVAAQLENQQINIQSLIDGFKTLASQHQVVIVEGAGGWEVPITENFSMADLATQLNIPIVIVVANRLGAINHSILTINAIRNRQLSITGIIMNHLIDELDTATISNKSVIPQLAKCPLLTEVIHSQDWIETDWLMEK
jgi:dethiobiotin synthetase